VIELRVGEGKNIRRPRTFHHFRKQGSTLKNGNVFERPQEKLLKSQSP
jgi:hypothetical protein